MLASVEIVDGSKERVSIKCQRKILDDILCCHIISGKVMRGSCTFVHVVNDIH